MARLRASGPESQRKQVRIGRIKSQVLDLSLIHIYAERHGFPVQDGAVGNSGFNAVADGMAEIEQGADIQCFQFIILHDALFHGVAGVFDVDFLALHIHISGKTFLHTAERPHEFTAPRSYQTDKSQDFTFSQVEIDIFEVGAV